MSTDLGFTRRLAEFCAGLDLDDIPADVVGHLKLCIADTLACGVFGSTLAWSQDVVSMCQRLGRDGSATVWGTGHALGADLATLANGAQVHSFEFDDLHRRAIVHPGGVTIPAVAAWAEQDRSQVISGREFLTAVAAGYEACTRVGLAVGLGLMRRGWHNNGVVGTFGAAAATGRMLRLDPAAMEYAISMAATQSGGLMAAQYGSSVKRLHAGRAAQSGLYAALLAAGGYRGIDAVLEAPYGGFASTFSDSSDLDEIVSGLGEQWRLTGVGFKPYPACGSSHTGIDAALGLLADGTVHIEDIDWIRLAVSTAALEHVGWPYRPDTVTTAQMSLRFAVATAFVHGSVTVDSFADDRLREPAVLSLIDRIEVHPDARADAGGRDSRHLLTMSVGLTGGQVVSREVKYARGSDAFPLSPAEVRAKCVSLFESVLPPGCGEDIWGAVDSLEEAGNVLDLLALLRPS